MTDRARSAIHKLGDAGIRFTITSGRPPLGMKMIADALKLTEPIAAFNGGLFVYPDFSMLEENVLPTTIVQDVIKIIAAHHLMFGSIAVMTGLCMNGMVLMLIAKSGRSNFHRPLFLASMVYAITWSKLWALAMT